jgi:hypothetical protein
MWRDLGTAFLWIGVMIVVGVGVGWYVTGSLYEVVGVGGFLAILTGGLLRSKGARQAVGIPANDIPNLTDE